MENKYKNSKKKNGTSDKFGRSFGSRKEQTRSRVLSLAQLLSRVRKQRNGSLQQSSGALPEISNANFFPPKKERSSFLGGSKSSNQQSVTGSKEPNTQNRNLQFGKQGPNSQREKFSSVSSNNMTKGLTRMEREEQKRQKPIKPMIPPKSLVIILKEKPEKILYNRRIIDYKHCGLLQRYIGLGGKILPRRQTRLTAKQQRYIAKTIKSARIMGLLPFVSKEKGFFR